MDTGNQVVVHKKKWDKFDLAFGSESKLDGGAFELWYDDKGAVYGFKYKGYLLAVEDSTGRKLFTKSAPMSATKYVDQILGFSEGTSFDRKYGSIGRESLSESKKSRN